MSGRGGEFGEAGADYVAEFDRAPNRLRLGELLREALELERDRFFLWAPVCFGAGIAVYFALPREPHLAAVCVPLVAVAIALALAPRGSLRAVVLTAMTLAAAGFTISKVRVDRVAAPVLTKPLRNVEVAGIAQRIEQRSERGQRVLIATERVGDLEPATRPRRVRIRLMARDAKVNPGDRVRLKANLSPPAKPALPGGFDFARTAWFDQIGGVGYSFAKPTIEKATTPASWRETFWRHVEIVRADIGDRVKSALPGETGAIATALINGERGGISAQTNEAFKDSGLFHILSISGLHMVIMAGAVFFIVRLMLAASPAIALRAPIQKIAAVTGIFAAFAYLILAGGAFATVRAALMITVMFIAVLLDRPALAMRNVALAALLILAVYPESLFDAGFQMSFAAVASLVAAYETWNQFARRRAPQTSFGRVLMFFAGIVASTLIASAAVAPFAAYHFHQSQQYAVLANVMAIPICNFIVMPAALAALVLMPFGLEAVALWPMGLGIEAMIWCANLIGSLPGAVGHIRAMPTASFALLACGGLWLVLWRARWRFLGLAAITSGLAVAPTLMRPDVLIAKGGELVAVRTPAGNLSALPARQASFEMQRWLESDGDGRTAQDALRGEGFKCDAVSCVVTVKGVKLAMPRHPSALVDDCDRARIVVLSIPRPEFCDRPETVIDLFDVWREAGFALYVGQAATGGTPAIRVETVTGARGHRPWSPVTKPATNGKKPLKTFEGNRNLPKPALGWSPDNAVGDARGADTDALDDSEP